MQKQPPLENIFSGIVKECSLPFLSNIDLMNLSMTSKAISEKVRNQWLSRSKKYFCILKNFITNKHVGGHLASPFKDIYFPTIIQINILENHCATEKIVGFHKLMLLIRLIQEPLYYKLNEIIGAIEDKDQPIDELESLFGELFNYPDIFSLLSSENYYYLNAVRQYKIACDLDAAYFNTYDITIVSSIIKKQSIFDYSGTFIILESIFNAAIKKNNQDMIILLLDHGLILSNTCSIDVLKTAFGKDFIFIKLIDHCIDAYIKGSNDCRWSMTTIKKFANYPCFLQSLYDRVVGVLSSMDAINKVKFLDIIIKNKSQCVAASLFNVKNQFYSLYKNPGKVFLDKFNLMRLALENLRNKLIDVYPTIDQFSFCRIQ